MLFIDPTFPQEELREKTGTTVPSQRRINPGAGSSQEARRDRKQAERYHAARSQEKKTTKNERMKMESNTTLPGAQKRQEKGTACGTHFQAA
jgi:hypothetical protein